MRGPRGAIGAAAGEMLDRVSPKKVFVFADATRPSGARRLAAFKKAWAGHTGSVETEFLVDFHPPSFMAGVMEMFNGASGARNGGNLDIQLHHADNLPEGIHSDSTRLRQVLVNLLGNAVKFTAAGRVDLEAKLDDRSGGPAMLKFLVRDTGIGMTEETISKLFIRFHPSRCIHHADL